MNLKENPEVKISTVKEIVMSLFKVYKFEEFILDPAKRELYQRERKVKLADKDFDVLLLLIEKRPNILSSSEIIDSVWNGINVENNSVDKALSNIRRVLNEDATNPRFIKNRRGRGYLFISDVEECEENRSAEKVGRSSVTPFKSKLNLLAIILILFSVCGFIWWKGYYIWSHLTKKTIFTDDFSNQELNTRLWKTRGNSVKVVDGVVKISIDETDKGGILESSDFSFDPNKPITIKSRIKVFYNQFMKDKVYFSGCFFILPNIQDSGERFNKDAVYDKYARGVYYTNYDEETHGDKVESRKTEGFFLVKPFGRPNELRSYNEGKIGPKMEPIWARWFEQKIVYDPLSGEMQYYINEEKASDFNVDPMPQIGNPQMRVFICPAGWWTNHSIELDYIEITQ